MATAVEIAVRASGADAARRDIQRLGSDVSRTGSKLSKLKSIGKAAAIGIGVAAAAAVAVGKKLIDAGERAGTANARIKQVATSMKLFGKETGEVTDRLVKLAEKTALQTGMDQNAIKETQAKLLTFKQLAKSADEVGGAFDRATQLAVDLEAAGFGPAKSSAVQLGKALNDPIKGITALNRQGITFTEQEKAKIATLVESGRQYKAQELILKAIETQVGGTAEATANGTDRMKVALSQVAERIGQKLVPMVDKFADVLINRVIPTLERWWDNLAPAREAIGKLARGIGEIIGLIRDAEWGKAWDKLREAARRGISAALQAVKTYLTSRLIPAIVAALQAARQAWADRWSNFWRDPAKAYRRTESETDSFGRRMTSRMRGIGIDTGVALIGSLRKMPEAAAREGIRTVSGLMQALRGAPRLAAAVALDVIGDLRRGMESGRAMMAAAGTNMILGLIDGIRWMAQRAIDAAVGVVKNAIQAAKNLLGISSPSREFIKIGRATVEGLVVGLRRGRGKAGGEAAKLMRTVLKAARDGAKGLRRELRELLSDRGLKKSELAKALRHLADESKKLTKVAERQARVNQRLSEARDRLRSLRKESRDYAASVKESLTSYASITNLDAAFNPTAIAAAMQARLEKMRQFSALLSQLRAGGLNQATLDQLVQGGVEGGLAYADAIASGGADAIAEINDLQNQIGNVAGDVGQTAAQNMYAAGIQAAEGLVQGLQAKERQLDRIANRLARKLIDAIKKELGIKSPSRVFQQLGKQTVEGLRIGLESPNVRRMGEVLARDLTTGFAKPELTARQVWDQTGGAHGGRQTVEVRLTAQQLSALQRGQAVAVDLNAFLAAGGKLVARP